MSKTVAQILGPVVLGVGLISLLNPDGIFLGLTNSDLLFDVLRILFGGLLTYAGYFERKESNITGIVGFIGVAYLAMGVLGIFDTSFFGLFPSGLTGIDIGLHLVSGAIATWAAFSGQTTGRYRVS